MTDTYGFRKQHVRSGFTLLELMIAAAIFGLLIMMAAPGILERMPHYRLRSAARQLNAHLRAARMKAMSTGNAVFTEFSQENNGAYKLYTEPDDNGRMAEIEQYDFTDLPGVIVSAYPAGGAFRPDGQFAGEDEYSNTLWIWMQTEDGSAYSSVVVWPSGQITVYQYSTS
jgi:prepilin-type N-terminal cleavage/methylation domain-containing protein